MKLNTLKPYEPLIAGIGAVAVVSATLGSAAPQPGTVVPTEESIANSSGPTNNSSKNQGAVSTTASSRGPETMTRNEIRCLILWGYIPIKLGVYKAKISAGEDPAFWFGQTTKLCDIAETLPTEPRFNDIATATLAFTRALRRNSTQGSLEVAVSVDGKLVLTPSQVAVRRTVGLLQEIVKATQ